MPDSSSETITVKFANNPSGSSKTLSPLAAYFGPQAARRAFGAALQSATRFRYRRKS